MESITQYSEKSPEKQPEATQQAEKGLPRGCKEKQRPAQIRKKNTNM